MFFLLPKSVFIITGANTSAVGDDKDKLSGRTSGHLGRRACFKVIGTFSPYSPPLNSHYRSNWLNYVLLTLYLWLLGTKSHQPEIPSTHWFRSTKGICKQHSREKEGRSRST